MKDDTWLNPADKQIALFVIKTLIEFAEAPEIQEATDGAFNPNKAVSMGKGLLKRKHILLESEYADSV